MAIYHLHLSSGSKGGGKVVGKGGGKSAAAKCDYITRDEKYIKGKEEVLTVENGYMPDFAKDNPRLFWQSADEYEAINGVVFRQLEFALPRELNQAQQIELCHQFAELVCGAYKLPYTFAIHKGEFDHRGKRTKNEPTPHCHLIFNDRGNDNITRTPELYFSRANTKGMPEKGGAKKIRELRKREWLIKHRELWANLANEALEKAGFSQRIDHRTLKDQGIDREPQKKRFWNAQRSKELAQLKEEQKNLWLEKAELSKQVRAIRTAIKHMPQPKNNHKGQHINDLTEFKALEVIGHLSDFQHLNNLKVVNYEISQSRETRDNLRDLPSRVNNEDPSPKENRDREKNREERDNKEDPLSSQSEPNLGRGDNSERTFNAGVQPLGERGGLKADELEKDKFIKKILSNPIITYEVILGATQDAISDYLSKKETNDKYETKISELTTDWRGRGARIKEYEDAKSEIKHIRKLWAQTERDGFFKGLLYSYSYKGVFRSWAKHRQELQKCFSEYQEIVNKYENELKTAKEGKEKITPELEKAKEKLSLFAEILRIKARNKYGYSQNWEREVIAKKNLSTQDKDILKTLQQLRHYRANPQELEPKKREISRTRSRGFSR